MILDKLAAATKRRIALEKEVRTPLQIKEQALFASNPNFAFSKALDTPSMSFICEIKKASPSKGIIAPDFPYLEIAKEYEDAGASAISVLTEPEFFKGSSIYLEEIHQHVATPLLRKEFILDEYQIYEAKAIGASAVLLICALLDTQTLTHFILLATSLSLDALVEVHSKEEVDMAVQAGAKIIGINNRDLKTFHVDLNTSLSLATYAPKDCILVAESGIRTKEEIASLEETGFHAVLIGETFMRAENKGEMLNYLRSDCKQ